METASIFVSIPAYRDPECQYTIIDLFQKAVHPERIFVGVCWQVDPKEDQQCFLLSPPGAFAEHVRELRLHHTEARGPCYARARIQQLYQGEDYYLQLDSHFRLIEGWDEELISQLAKCDSAKPILSTYPSSYTLPEDYRPGAPDSARLAEDRDAIVLCARDFGSDGFLRITGKTRPCNAPVPGLFWAAGFAFSAGRVVAEVPYDVTLEDLFFGEESSMAVRLWTSGWDFFAPSKVIGYHLWSREHRPNFREHTSEERKQRLASSQRLVMQQLTGESLIKGERSLLDYEAFAGLSFRHRTLSERACWAGLDPKSFEAPSTKSYPKSLPGKAADAILAMLGQEAPAAAPTVLFEALAPRPPRLLPGAGGHLRWLQPGEVEALNSKGIVIIDGFLGRCYPDAQKAIKLLRNACALAPLRPARMGEAVWRSQDVRGDEMTWLKMPLNSLRGREVLERQALCEAPQLEDLDLLLCAVAALKEDFQALGLETSRLSAMLARYRDGARYARHRDGQQRRLTATYYMNAWAPELGGCFRAHLPSATGAAVPGAVKSDEEMETTEGMQQVYHLDVEPLADRLVLFSSQWLEHEVLPAYGERLAITTWFY